MITAKVICNSKQESGEGDDRQVTVTFGADYADGRNKEWARYTPSLSLTMGLKGEVADRFEPSKSYLLTFAEEPAEPAEQADGQPVDEPVKEQGDEAQS